MQKVSAVNYSIPIDKITDKPGEWRADIYANDVKVATHPFYIPGSISATIYPAIGFTFSTFPLFGALFLAMIARKKKARPRVALIENWKTNGLIIGHFITIIWALILIAFLFLNKFIDGRMNGTLSYGLFLISVIFCYFSTKMIRNFFTYRKLSKNDLYFNGSLSMSIAILSLFSGAFVPASISEAALLSFVIVFIPLFTPNFISLSVVRKNGELLLAKEATIPVTPTFPQELLRYYKDAEYIGGGGFAWVFRAIRKDGTKVAVKIPAIKDENTGKLFLREVANWSALAHENIVKFHKANVFPIPLLEMELCDSCLAPGKRTIEEAALIIYEAAKGLEYAHEEKLVHADIKHSNILLKDGKIKISDWGLSKVKRGRSLSVSALTPEYAAPEQIMGKIDERTDIWQLGVVFYELVTGKFPFEGEYADVINQVIKDEPISPSEINPESKCVENIIMKCLRKERDERYKNMSELIDDIKKFVSIENKITEKSINRIYDKTIMRK